MDKEALKTKVQTSKLLTEADRTYWLNVIPLMNPEQLQKLEQILTKAASLPWKENEQRMASIVEKATNALAA